MHLDLQNKYIKVLTGIYLCGIIKYVKKVLYIFYNLNYGRLEMTLNTRQLEQLIEIKREELNRLYGEYGLNDLTLAKSQELDKLIIQVQIIKLEQEKAS